MLFAVIAPPPSAHSMYPIITIGCRKYVNCLIPGQGCYLLLGSSLEQLTIRWPQHHLRLGESGIDIKKVIKSILFLFQIRQLKEMGLMGACASEDYGGMGMDYLSLAIAVEELSRGCASTGLILSIHNFLYLNLVNEKGTPEQKEFFLKDFTRNSIGCFALSEPGRIYYVFETQIVTKTLL